jgi:hypothetical protein
MNGYKVFQSTENYFDQAWKLPFSFWTYRRVAANSALSRPSGTDLAMINWSHGNDFNVNCGSDGCNIIGRPRAVQQRIEQRAKNFALGFVYWLQTTVPRDDNPNSFGYGNLKLVIDGMGSADGMSQYPYIRESRRLLPLKTVVEQDAASTMQKNQRFIVFRSAATVRPLQLDEFACRPNHFPLLSRSMETLSAWLDMSTLTFIKWQLLVPEILVS